MVPTPSQPFLFFKLPSELRIHTLRYLLKCDKDVRQMPADRTANSPAVVPIDLRLFAVSRRMSNEAEEVFYNANMLRLDIEKDMQELPLWIRRPVDASRKARSVHLRICQDHYGGMPGLLYRLKLVTHGLMQCPNLAILKTTPNHCGCWGMLGCFRRFDEAIDVLSSLRGIKSVLWRREMVSRCLEIPRTTSTIVVDL